MTLKGMSLVPCGLMLAVALAPAAYGSTPCGTLKKASVPADRIGLPTRGAIVRYAQKKRLGGTTFCEVRGDILSIDPQANPIRFQLNLPENWIGKAAQFGGGAFNGYLVTGTGPGVLGDKRKPTPLERGYATFGSDSGHHHHYLFLPQIVNAVNAKFALNDEERHNFASDGLKKTHDVAMELMRAHYGATPSRMYFLGGSTGGREAMMVVDRWPKDYDGVLAAYAAWNQIESDLQFIRISEAIYTKGSGAQRGWLSKRDTALLHSAVLEQCDAADGLRDGIVSEPDGCHFDPAKLRCPDGRAHRGCLSDGQLRTVAAYSEDSTSQFALKNGMTFEPGYNVLRGADLTGTQGLCRHAYHPAIPLLNSFLYVVSDGVLRFFLTKDPHFATLTFDTQTGSSPGLETGHWIAGIRQQSEEDDASAADLTPFATHGGKLLLVHGTADTTIPTNASVLLYQRIVKSMGKEKAEEFLRLYLIPGFGHGGGTFDAAFDALGTLDAWADKGIKPGHLDVDDQHSTRSRPMCSYPAWPKYVGGNPDLAASFTCTSAETSPPQLAAAH